MPTDTARSQPELEELAWAIEFSQGEFALLLAHCNYRHWRDRIIQQLQVSCSADIQVVEVAASTRHLYRTLSDRLGDCQPQALMVTGLDALNDLDAVLIAANQVREEFPKSFQFPLVLWINDVVQATLMKRAPDLESWATTTEFAIAPGELVPFIQQTAREAYQQILETGAIRLVGNVSANPESAQQRRSELQAARKDLQAYEIPLTPDLEADLEFLLGIESETLSDAARQHYERSLQCLQQLHAGSENFQGRRDDEGKGDEEDDEGGNRQLLGNSQPTTPLSPSPSSSPSSPSPITSYPTPLISLKQACLLYRLGVWWRTRAIAQQANAETAYLQARTYFQQCLDCFEQSQRPDLVARFITALGDVLQYLDQWDELELLAQRALDLQALDSDPLRTARICGFLAKVARSRRDWPTAERHLHQALAELDRADPAAATTDLTQQRDPLEWVRAFNRSWYLFTLAKTQQDQGDDEASLQNLEIALTQTKPHYEPRLYLRILDELRNAHFRRRDYLKAYEFKQENRSIAQQFNILAFIGAGRLKPEQQAQLEGSAASVSLEPTLRSRIATEIVAAGRQADVEHLVERIGRTDFKVTVLYGFSGVGKSSLLNAGLVPTLKQRSIGPCECLPVAVRNYRDWQREVVRCLAAALAEKGIVFTPPDAEEDVEAAIVAELRQLESRNLRPVLLFDQLEELFFLYRRAPERNAFFLFLGECLKILPLKVVLSIRRDQLYRLLGRPGLDSISNDILSKQVLYKISNFSDADARRIIQQLTDRVNFHLEPALVDAVAADLSGGYGKVRPIELQIVGAQLQAENITTLAQYQALGEKPKRELVRRYLEIAIADCGPENESAASFILYLLTDAAKIRPLKTRAEIEAELRVLAPDLKVRTEQLELVLTIFVKAGLAFQLQDARGDRYQLVHDYLAAFIRKQQEPKIDTLIRELNAEREQRQQLEMSLEEMQAERDRIQQDIQRAKQQLQAAEAARQDAQIAADLERAGVTALRQFEFSQLEALLTATKAGLQLKSLVADGKSIGQYSLTPLRALQQILERIQEKNCLNGHQRWIGGLCFSPDGQILVSGSSDGKVIVWDLQGHQLRSFLAHSDAIYQIQFSPNCQIIATSGRDCTVKLWDLQGNQLLNLAENQGDPVSDISFSPTDKIFATSLRKGEISLWDYSGQSFGILGICSGGIRGIAFSPDGQFLAAACTNGFGQLWDLQGNQLATFPHDDQVLDIAFSPNGQLLATSSYDGIAKLWDLEGKLLAVFRGHQSVIRRLTFSPDGNHLITISGDTSVRIWDLTGNQLVKLSGHQDHLNGLSFSPDGKYLATSSNDRTIRLWDLQSNQPIICCGHQGVVNDVRFSPDGQRLATASRDCTGRLWDLYGNQLLKIQEHDARVWSINFSPDGQHLATASTDRTVKLWDAQGNCLREFTGYDRWVSSVCFSPDSELLAAASGDGTAKLWTLDGQQITLLQGHEAEIWSIAFSPDGQFLATASADTTVRLWDLAGQHLLACSNTQTRINSVSFSPDGQSLASAASDGTVTLWDLQGNQLLKFVGHQGVVWSVCFSPDGQTLATASSDRTARLWDLEGNQLAEYQGHEGVVWSACFSPDGKTLATASADGTARLWRIESLDRLLTRACDWLQDYLTTNPYVAERDRNLCNTLISARTQTTS